MTKCKLSVSCHSVFQHNGWHTQNGRCLTVWPSVKHCTPMCTFLVWPLCDLQTCQMTSVKSVRPAISSTKPVWPSCWFKTCMGANFTLVVQQRPFPVAKTVKNHGSLAGGEELVAPSQEPHSRLGLDLQPFEPPDAALWALPHPLRLCPRNDLLRNFSVLVGLNLVTLTSDLTRCRSRGRYR